MPFVAHGAYVECATSESSKRQQRYHEAGSTQREIEAASLRHDKILSPLRANTRIAPSIIGRMPAPNGEDHHILLRHLQAPMSSQMLSPARGPIFEPEINQADASCWHI